MKKAHKFICYVLGLGLLTACSPEEKSTTENSPSTNSSQEIREPKLSKDFLTDCKKLFKEARQVDSTLMEQIEIDTTMANKAIKAFTDFAYYCQSDSMSPVFLIKTAQVARAINNVEQAKVALEHCIDTYLNFKNRPAALFLLAQLYDEPAYLNNENAAKHLYEQIISEYPKSDWALNAKAALTFLGKSDSDIIKEFNKKSKKAKA